MALNRRELFIAMTGALLQPTARERLIYVGTYTGETSKGIYAFRFNDSSGALTPLGLAAETPSPSFLTASADGRFVYAVNELQTVAGAPGGSVTSFSSDAAAGRLTAISVQSSKGAGPCHLALDRTERYLAVANYGGGNYALLPVRQDGRLDPAVAVVSGTGTVQPSAKPLERRRRCLPDPARGILRSIRTGDGCPSSTSWTRRSRRSRGMRRQGG